MHVGFNQAAEQGERADPTRFTTLLCPCLPAVCGINPLQAFDTVGWLDLTAAKVRFGLWLGGVLPTFTPWEQVFERRPPGAPFGAPLPPSSGGWLGVCAAEGRERG